MRYCACLTLICLIVASIFGCASSKREHRVDYLASKEVSSDNGGGDKPSIFSSCPPDMVMIPSGPTIYGPPEEKAGAAKEQPQRINMRAFCIDKYEYPNKQGEPPTRLVTWLEANTMCTTKNKRLCTEFEFEKACRGPTGTLYAYGDGYAAKACSTSTDDYGLGQFTNCVSGFGVYDMSGGIFEWTSSAAPAAQGQDDSGLRIVRGGMNADKSEQTSKCTYRLRFQTTVTAREIGFRCCGALTKEEVK
jgi:formylglycine-generating enzyme required for sulfatase activity